MSTDPQLFRIHPGSNQSDRIEEVDFAVLGFQERRDIQEWVASNPGILGDDLIIIGKEFSGFDKTNERLDLLAVDSDGKLVIIELKRDDTGADAHWQAIKYASYLHRTGADAIVSMLANIEEISQEDAEYRLLQHLGADDLNALNNDQRIILASHRFAPEVTSAALWLNEKAPGENLVTCIRLTPYQDAQNNSLYVQASTIIPVPGIEDYVVSVGSAPGSASSPEKSSSFAKNLKASYARHKNDHVTHFLRDTVGPLVLDRLTYPLKPDKKGKWAGRGNKGMRYYHFWYKSPPWGNWKTSYRINLEPQEEANTWSAEVEFRHQLEDLTDSLSGIGLEQERQLSADGIVVKMGTGALDDKFAGRIADAARQLIGYITPIVNNLEDASNETEV